MLWRNDDVINNYFYAILMIFVQIHNILVAIA